MELQQVVPYSQLRDGRRADLASKLPLPMPFAIHIETTNRCNFKCRMCPVSFDDYETVVGGITRIPFAAIERLYADLGAMHPGTRLKVIRFYGEGEPMLDKDLPRAIRLAHDFNVTERTEVTSNGSALTEKVGRSLIESGLTYLRISIYGMTEAKQKLVTQSNVTADRIYNNVRKFREMRDSLGQNAKAPFLYVKMIDNGDAEEIALLRDRYGPIADEVIIEPAMDWDSYEQRNLVQLISPPLQSPAHKKKACPYPFYSLVIKANGDVVACCVDWNKHTAVGNIHHEAFSAIWTGQRLRDFRRMHLDGRRGENPSCANCWFLETVPDDLDAVPSENFDQVLG